MVNKINQCCYTPTSLWEFLKNNKGGKYFIIIGDNYIKAVKK